MNPQRTLILGALMFLTAAAGTGVAQGAFVEIDAFENLELGPIGGQNDWRAYDPMSEVVLDPADPSNQVLSVLTSSTVLSHPAILPAGQTRMLFMRFRYEEQLSISFGMAASSYPSQFGDFDVELSLTSTRDDLRINDDGTYTELTVLEPEHWYNCWLYIDNEEDVTSIWIHDRPNEAATDKDRLVVEDRDSFLFRDPASGDLQTFYIKTGGGDGVAGPLILDDIYLQDTDEMDLSFPADHISGVADQPDQLHLCGAWPNPFNPQTTISFTLDTAQAVELAVYDVKGSLVRRLDAGLRDAGSHNVPWDGRDHAGASVASGVYLVNLTGRNEFRSTKLVLAR